MAYDPSNIFARILSGEVPAKKLYENEFAIAIADVAPAAPAHALVLPRGEYVSFDDFARSAPPETVTGFFRAVAEVARALGVDQSGYRLIANHGHDASQTVPHFHVHVLGGRALGGLLPGDTLNR